MSIVSLILTTIFPPLGLPLGAVGLQRDNRYWKRYILCLSLFLAGVAYAYTPTLGSDLVRYAAHFETFGKKTFIEAITYKGQSSGALGSGLYALYMFYWLMGKAGDYHLASALTTFVIYYIGFYVTCDIGQRLQTPWRSINLYLTFIILSLNYHGIINNIRNIFAFALIGLAIYRDCCQKRKNVFTLLLYLIAIFFHPSAIFLVLLRFLLELPDTAKLVAGFLMLGAPTFIEILNSNLYRLNTSNFLITLFANAVRKGYLYFNDTDSDWGLRVQSSGSQLLMRIVYISLAVLFCVTAVVCFIRRFREKQSQLLIKDKLHKVYFFDLYTGFLTIACVSMLTPEYWRFVSAMILFGGCLYMYASRSSTRLVRYLINMIFLLAPCCTALYIRSLYMSSEIKLLLTDQFFASPIVVLIKDLIHAFGG